MGKKHKQTTQNIAPFSYRTFILYFLYFYCISLIILFAITPLLSFFRLEMIRWFVALILKNKTPFIHPIPFFRSLSLSLPVFSGLFLAYRRVRQNKTIPLKKELLLGSICLFILWMIEIGTKVLEIVVIKLNIATFFPNFMLNVLLTIGVFSFPVLLWLLVFRPTIFD
jgi:hypothetical protein